GRSALSDPVLDRIPVAVGVRLGEGAQRTLGDRVAVPDDLTADPDVVAELGQRLVVHQAQVGVHDHVVDHHTAGVGVHPQGVAPVAGPEVAVRGRPVGADLHHVGVATDAAGALHGDPAEHRTLGGVAHHEPAVDERAVHVGVGGAHRAEVPGEAAGLHVDVPGPGHQVRTEVGVQGVDERADLLLGCAGQHSAVDGGLFQHHPVAAVHRHRTGHLAADQVDVGVTSTEHVTGDAHPVADQVRPGAHAHVAVDGGAGQVAGLAGRDHQVPRHGHLSGRADAARHQVCAGRYGREHPRGCHRGDGQYSSDGLL